MPQRIWLVLLHKVQFLLFSKDGGGRSSDEHIIEKSTILRTKYHHEKVMAGRGYNISELLGPYGPQLEGKSHFLRIKFSPRLRYAATYGYLPMDK